MNMQSEDEIRPGQQLHVAHNFLVALSLGNELIAPMRKWMRADRRDLEFAAPGQRGETTSQLRHMRPGIIDVAANFRAQLNHRLMHLRLDLLLERKFAVLQNFMNVRAQLARLGIDDGEFFLDAEGEDMICGAHGNKNSVLITARCHPERTRGTSHPFEKMIVRSLASARDDSARDAGICYTKT